MELSTFKQLTGGDLILLTISASTDIEQTSRVFIQKEFPNESAADGWYAGRETSIIHCLKELEDVCKD